MSMKNNANKVVRRLGPLLSKNSLAPFVRVTGVMLVAGLEFRVVVGQQSSESVTRFDRTIRVF